MYVQFEKNSSICKGIKILANGLSAIKMNDFSPNIVLKHLSLDYLLFDFSLTFCTYKSLCNIINSLHLAYMKKHYNILRGMLVLSCINSFCVCILSTL